MSITTTIDREDVVDAPSDSVTLLLSDMEQSTHLVQALGDSYERVFVRSQQLQQTVAFEHHAIGRNFEGDGFFAVFSDAGDAVHAAVEIQRAFHSEPWPHNAPVRVRIGLHTGKPKIVDGIYVGLDVNRTARIAAAASGGQVILSAATRTLLRSDDLPAGIAIRDLGAHRLRDIRYPELLFDLSIAGVPAPLWPLRAPETRPNNLPLSPTTFIGRERQVRHVCDLLLQPDTRLLTLTGPGGTGKTRLALETARTVLANYSHGVFFVPLAPVSDRGLLASTIVRTLGVPEFATVVTSPLELLKHHLAERQVLLVLDNLEQILDAAGDVLDLLGSCPRLKVLVTSREPLNIRLEREYAVPPLQLPQKDTRSDIRSVAEIESVRLVVDRIRKYEPDFNLTTTNADVICAICTRLDGLPLALELAASQLRLYTPQLLLENLRNSLEVLTGGPQDLERHQRTLHDTIAWSYELLTVEEQRLFQRLAVFRGGSSIDSAVSVCSDGVPGPQTVNALRSLVTKSLVTQTSVEGEARLGMLETIHEFASKRLVDTAEDQQVRQRHAAHYLAVAERLAPGLVGRDQRRFVVALLGDQDNVHAALEWGIEHDDADLTSRLLNALVWMWIPRGQFDEGHRWTEKALQRFAGPAGCRELAIIREVKGWLHVLSGNYEQARPFFEQSYEVFQTLPDAKDRVRSIITRAVTYLVLSLEPAYESLRIQGGELSDRALVECDSLADTYLRALALLSAGIKHQFAGDAAQAATCYEQSLQAFHECDNVFWPGQALQNLALLRLGSGDWQSAVLLAGQAYDLGRAYDYPIITNLSLGAMGAVALTKGAPVDAAHFFGVVEASLAELKVDFEPPERQGMNEAIAATESILGKVDFKTAFEEGGQWSESDTATAVLSLRQEATG